MLWTIIVILVILWLLGFFGRNINPGFPANRQLDSHSDRDRRHPRHIAPPWCDVTLS